MDLFAVGLNLKAEGDAIAKVAVKGVRDEVLKLGDATKSVNKIATEGWNDWAKKALTAGAAIAVLALGVRKLITESVAAQEAETQLISAIETTGKKSKQTAEGIKSLAAELQATTTASDDAVVAMSSVLLTFDKIQGDTFPRATRAIVDMAARLRIDLSTASRLVGKALQDPELGLMQLRRVGVDLDDQLESTVGRLLAVGRSAEAQGIVLDALEGKFKGAGAAARNDLGGALTALGNSWGDLFEVSRESSQGIIDLINGISLRLPGIRDSISSFVTDSMTLIKEFNVWLERSNQKWFEREQRAAQEWANLFGTLAKIPGTEMSDRLRDYFQKRADESGQLAEQYKINATELQAALDKFLLGTIGIRDAANEADGAVSGLADSVGDLIGQLKKLPEPGRGTDTMDFGHTAAKMGAKSGKITPAGISSALSEAYKQLVIEGQKAAAQASIVLEKSFAENIAGAITGGIVAGIEQGIASGSIGEGFKALTGALLSGLGSSMIEFGVASLNLAVLMEGLLSSLSNLLPGGAIAKAVAMIALGAALKGVASRAFGGQSRGAGSFGSGFSPAFSSGSAAVPTTRLIFGSTSAGAAAGMAPRTSDTFIIIGPDDPRAQRTIEELISKSRRRGSLG